MSCCIPQRDFDACESDNVTVMEQSLEKSATTMVLWSQAALTSKWHKVEYKMARYIELYQRFDHRVIHVCLQDVSGVEHDDLKLLLRGGDYIQWSKEATFKDRQLCLEKLMAKIFGRMKCKVD